MKIEVLSLTEPFHKIRLVAENDTEKLILELWYSEDHRVFAVDREADNTSSHVTFARTYRE